MSTRKRSRLPKSSVHDDRLVSAAVKARDQAYAPYSGFRVGAAIRTKAGQVFTGCNVENSSFGMSMCAERSAVFAAISAGARAFSHIALIADSSLPLSPCGACRQVLAEFGPNIIFIMANMKGQVRRQSLKKLLPLKFALTARRLAMRS